MPVRSTEKTKKIRLPAPSERTESERQDEPRAQTRPRVLTANTQTNLKASTTAQHHVHARPAVGITSTEPGRKASPCKPGGRARPREIFETKTKTITKRKSRHAYEPSARMVCDHCGSDTHRTGSGNCSRYCALCKTLGHRQK